MPEPRFTAIRTPGVRGALSGFQFSGSTKIGAVSSGGRLGGPSGAALELIGPRYSRPHSEELGASGGLEEPVHGEDGKVLGHQKLAFDITSPVRGADGRGRDMPPRVDQLAASKDSRHLVPALAGLAAQESVRRWGVLPTHGTSLSGDSEHLVNYLVGRGLMQPSPAGFESNGIAANRFRSGRFVRDTLKAHAKGLKEAGTDADPTSTVSEMNHNVGAQFYRHAVAAARGGSEERRAAENAKRYPQTELF